MKLPHPDRAVVDAAKVRDYLLSDSHATGRFKAAVFKTLGYSADHWETLAQELRRHAEENDAFAKEANEYGQKYEVRGRLKGPNGRDLPLVAVWIVLFEEDLPRFITAYPGS